MGKKVQKEQTIGCIEAVVDKTAKFEKWGPFSDIEIMPVEGFVPDLKDPEYVKQLVARMEDRVRFVESRKTEKGGFDELPEDALEAIKKVVEEAKKIA